MIKQLSSDYYALKLELPCIMLEDRIWGSRTGKLLIQIRTGRYIVLDSCLFSCFSGRIRTYSAIKRQGVHIHQLNPWNDEMSLKMDTNQG